MRCCLLLAFPITIGLVSAPSGAEFVLISGTKHASGSVTDFSGFDSFSLTEPVPVGFDVLGGNAESPGMWSNSGAGSLTEISSSFISVIGDAMGNTPLDSGATMSALASGTVTFTIERTKLVHWDFFTIVPDGAFASIELVGPGGVVPAGDVALVPGEYTITGMAGYTDLFLTASDDSPHARYYSTLENIPAPGAAGLLAMGSLFVRSRRRR